MPAVEGQSAIRSPARAPAGQHLGVRAQALARRAAPAIAGYGLPFLLVSYLALNGGGYDAVVRGEIGVAAWWLVILGAAVGALPASRITPSGWLALALLGGLAVWTTLGITWSGSSERSVAEVARVAALLGVLALALAAQGREGLRRSVYGVAAAIALIGAIALLSRLQPQLFPANEAAELLGGGYRLNYPLDYWNGLAALLAIGLPLVVWIAAHARHLASQGLAAAAIPALALAGYYTFSRGGVGAAALALAVLLALHPRRLALAVAALPGTVGAALLIAAAAQRAELADGLTTATALAQGDAMLATALIVCAGVGLVQVGIGIAARNELGPRVEIGRRRARVGLAAAAAMVLAVALAVDAPGVAGDRWQDFKATGTAPGQGAERFESVAGNSRYQYWQAAIDANATRPLSGIGPGTYEFWWAREGSVPGFVRDAHSLYLEKLGELGIIGLALVAALVLLVIGAGATRALAAGAGERRSLLAAATAAATAFAFAAAIDWAWELSVLPVAFLILAAAILGPSAESRWRRSSRFERRPLGAPGRAAVAVVGLAAIVGIAVPLASETLIRDSQAAVNGGDLDRALADARSAARAQPHTATPRLQEALVLELRGDLDGALVAARAATGAEPIDWRTWLVRARIAARAGAPAEAVHAYEQARELNPRSRLLRGGG